MGTKSRRLVRLILLVVLALIVLVSAYQAAFSAWMTAHPVYRSDEWANRFYLRVGTIVVCGAAWLWVFRRGRNREKVLR